MNDIIQKIGSRKKYERMDDAGGIKMADIEKASWAQ